MKNALLTAMLLGWCLAAARAGEGVAPASKEPLWFRIVAGGETTTTVLGFLDESEGTGRGYDVAVLDLDGDGAPETRRQGELSVSYGEDDERTFKVPEISFPHGGRDLSISFFWIEEARPEVNDGVARTEVDWGLWGEGGGVSFRGELRLYPSREAASKAEPVRIGAPFTFRIETGRRGPAATVTPTLLDAGGFALAGGWRGESPIRPHVEILRGDATVAEGDADFG